MASPSSLRHIVAFGLLAAACSSVATESGSSSRTGDNAGVGKPENAGSAPPAGEAASTGSRQSGGGKVPLKAGTLTAGVWDDNRNYDLFLDFLKKNETLVPSFPLNDDERKASFTRFSQRPSHTKLDIALVIDTTGSMGDELKYLQTELDAIAASVATNFPNAESRWALTFYRDEGDEYVTRPFDFRTDLAAVRTDLAAQSANGGGDFPEASHEGLAATMAFAWRSDPSVAKLAFWVADAPHHDASSDAIVAAVKSASAKDVHIYPIASSGITTATERSMRAAAQLTGGRYLFLTDDSGVGGAHIEPSIPCYFVTKLDGAVLRMIDIEMTGIYKEPAAADILRTGGDPKDGSCALGDAGVTASVF